MKRWLGRKAIERIVFEATAPYHRALNGAFLASSHWSRPTHCNRVAQIAELSVEMSQHITRQVSLGRKREIFCSLQGIGSIAAAMILGFPPEIGSLDRKVAGCLAGLVPHRLRQSREEVADLDLCGQISFSGLLNGLKFPTSATAVAAVMGSRRVWPAPFRPRDKVPCR